MAGSIISNNDDDYDNYEIEEEDFTHIGEDELDINLLDKDIIDLKNLDSEIEEYIIHEKPSRKKRIRQKILDGIRTIDCKEFIDNPVLEEFEHGEWKDEIKPIIIKTDKE